MTTTLPVSYTSVTLIASAFPFIFSASNVTSAVVALYAGQEEAYINAKLSKQYKLPFTTVVPMLVAMATDLTISALLLKRVAAHFTTQQNQQNPFIELRKMAVELLDQVADGSIPLVTESGDVLDNTVAGTQAYSTTMGYNPTFHEGSWEDMTVDPNKLDDILNR